MTLFVTRFFMGFLKLAEGGEGLICKKTMTFVSHFYLRNSRHVALHFLYEKKHFVLRFKSKIYRIVLIPNYKHTYDNRDQNYK